MPLPRETDDLVAADAAHRESYDSIAADAGRSYASPMTLSRRMLLLHINFPSSFYLFPPPFGGRVSVGGKSCDLISAKRLLNNLKNAFKVLQDVIIPKSQNSKTLRFEILSSSRIDSLVVLPAIHFHDQLTLQTNKVYDIRRNRMLKSKLTSGALPIP